MRSALVACALAACSVPLDRYHVPDGPPADGPPDGPPRMLMQEAYVKASNTGAGDRFGTSVAMSADGSTLAIGAFRESSDSTGIGGNQTNNAAADAGAVYVFARSGGAWSQQAYVKASNTDADDFFGVSVALSADGSTLAVGAYSEDSAATGIGGDQANDTAGAAGAVYVFARSGAVWSQQAYVKASNTDAGDMFGKSVALSADGSTLAVGAYGEDSAAIAVGGDQSNDNATDAGAVYVFARSGAAWSQQAYLKGLVTTAFDEFGTSVSLSADGSTLAVGASRETLASNTGSVCIFTRAGAAWSARVQLSYTDSMGTVGNSVSLSADGVTLAVGASREASTNAPGGAVYVLSFINGAWFEQGVLTAPVIDAGDLFGQSVALSSDGSRLVIGAPGEASAATGIGGQPANNAAMAAGAVYVFARAGTVWSARSYVKASNTGAGDRFGESVGISGDGAAFAVGAIEEDGASMGVGGDQSSNAASNAGAVYVFR